MRFCRTFLNKEPLIPTTFAGKKGQKPFIHKMQPIIHAGPGGAFSFIIWLYQRLRNNLNDATMKKCVVLFVILIFALIFAAVLESKELKMQSDWNKVVNAD